MDFFNKLSSKEIISKGTTKNFFIGTPEAEGETTYNSKIKLGEIFIDFLQVFSELNSEKFIITGRKGSGKSAIAEFILFKASNEPNVFTDFIKTRDFHIHKIIQLGKDNGLPIEEKLLFEWIILTKLIRLFTKDQSLQSSKEMRDLEKFVEKNIGFIDIKEYEVDEVVTQKSFEVDIEYFKRAFSSIFKKEVGIKSHKAAFYKLLPLLQQTVVKLLKDTVDHDNDYCLIFDDLDIGFKESDINSIENLTNVLRIAKDYNIDFFGKNGLKVKIIILLRDDLKRIIVKNNADTAKIFSSYEIPLIWYEHENFKNNENAVALKQLINKRIEINFKNNSIPFYEDDPWSSLVKFDYYYDGSSFKHVIDHTFFRPRDLILFFKPLPKSEFKIPLTNSDINKLINKYVEELVWELQNELSASFSTKDISIIFLALKNLHRKTPFSKNDIIQEFKNLNLEYDPELSIIHLFDYCILGNIDTSEYPSKIYFKHREKREEPTNINLDMKFIFHQAIRVYFDKRV